MHWRAGVYLSIAICTPAQLHEASSDPLPKVSGPENASAAWERGSPHCPLSLIEALLFDGYTCPERQPERGAKRLPCNRRKALFLLKKGSDKDGGISSQNPGLNWNGV